MSKKCNKCGNYVDDAALFCTQCGNRISIVSDEALKIERVTFEKEQEELNKKLAEMNKSKTNTTTTIPNNNAQNTPNSNDRNNSNVCNLNYTNLPLNKNIYQNNCNMQYQAQKAPINNYNQIPSFNQQSNTFNLEKINDKYYLKLPLNLTIVLGICIVILLLLIIVLILL